MNRHEYPDFQHEDLLVTRWTRRTILAFAAIALLAAAPSARADDALKRYLFASLHHSQRFDEPTEQGLFVYDIDHGHRRVEKFPAKTWKSWSGGWAGIAAHAGTGRVFQVQDGQAIRAYDILGKRLLWERHRATPADRRWAEAAPGRDLHQRAFAYIDRRFGVTKDGKYLLVPDRDSAKIDKEKGPVGLGVPVVRVLDAATGQWVKNIPLVDPQGEDEASRRGSPHNVHVMRRYAYASKWHDGYVYCIDTERLEVVRRLGPVQMREKPADAAEQSSTASLEGRDYIEPTHRTSSIQHFSVDPAERYVYAEPVPAFGLGILDVETGDFVGQWPIPDPEPGSLRARRMAIEEAKANKLHSKRNHGIAARPCSTEVWMTDDYWGMVHIWDTATIPPKYEAAVPVFEDIRQPIADFSWLNFNIDGRYCYASNRVIDAQTHEIVAKLDGLNEASLEVQVHRGRVVRTGHDMGSGLDTWAEGYETVCAE